ncbi:MAG: Spy/CpxP family protein refolding chaperone [Hyphomicrobiaceae bacterium]|jgi:Spy/CpxP family protein refolding chaperone
MSRTNAISIADTVIPFLGGGLILLLLLLWWVPIAHAAHLPGAPGCDDSRRDSSCGEPRQRHDCNESSRGSGGSGRGVPGGWIESHAERLGLDEATTAAIRDTVEKSRVEHGAFEARLGEANQELRALLGEDLPDEAAVMAVVEKVGAVEIALKKNRYRAMLRIRGLMNDKQRRELMVMREEWHSRSPEE